MAYVGCLIRPNLSSMQYRGLDSEISLSKRSTSTRPITCWSINTNSPFFSSKMSYLSLITVTKPVKVLNIVNRKPLHVQNSELINYQQLVKQAFPNSVDLDELLTKYPNISRQELVKLRETLYDLELLESKAQNVDERNKFEKMRGREHLEVGPLVQVVSISILPDQVDVKKPLRIYGRIYIEFYHITTGDTITYDLYNRVCDDPETLNLSGILALTSPNKTSPSCEYCIPVDNSERVVDIWDADEKEVLVKGSFYLEDVTKSDYEQVNMEVVRGLGVQSWPIKEERGSLAVHYLTMPFAIPCRVDVQFYHRKNDQKRGNLGRVLNVYGKIVARYGNTYGNYSGEKFTIFKKESHEFEPVVIDRSNPMKLSICWLNLPAYSSLIIEFDLYEFDTKKSVFKGAVEWLPQTRWESHEGFVFDDIVMQVTAAWFNHKPRDCGYQCDEDDEEADESSDDESSSDTSNSRDDLVHSENEPQWCKSPYVEVYSIFIGRQKMTKALRIYGTIEVSSGNHLSYIFKRDEEDAYELSADNNLLPILDGSSEYDKHGDIELKLDLKDVNGNLFIKGFIEIGEHERNHASPPRCDTQICSVIQGKHGFAAVQYSVTSSSFHASIEKLSYKLTRGVSLDVYGRIFVEHDAYDYSTPFQKNYFRTVLFDMSEKDMIVVGSDRILPLRRPSFLVQEDYSSIYITGDLTIVDLLTGVARRLSHSVEVKVGVSYISFGIEECLFDINLKWKTSD